MTCRHVLDLIDAEPFVDHPAPHLEAAWVHARTCATCGPALAASRAMTPRLRGLAQPPAPVDLKTSAMARIARLDEAGRADVPASSVHPARMDWAAWPAAACLTIGFVIVAVVYGTTGDIRISRVRLSGPAMVPESAAALLALTSGLACYVTGLLLPLAGRRRTPAESRVAR